MHDLMCDVFAKVEDERYGEFYVARKQNNEPILAGYYIESRKEGATDSPHVAHIHGFENGSPLPTWFDITNCYTRSSQMLHARVRVTGLFLPELKLMVVFMPTTTSNTVLCMCVPAEAAVDQRELTSELWKQVADLAGVSRVRVQHVGLFRTDSDDVEYDFWFTLLDKTDFESDGKQKISSLPECVNFLPEPELYLAETA